MDATGNDLTCRIIGLAMKVHNELGYGFNEEVYDRNISGNGGKESAPVCGQPVRGLCPDRGGPAARLWLS